MPGNLVTAMAVVMCPHGGKVAPTKSSTRVTLSGQAATTVGAPWQATCPGKPPAVPTPCSVVAFSPGTLRVTSEGLNVILTDTIGQCTPNGPATISMTQTRAIGGG